MTGRGDWSEQDDQGEVSIIIFAMSKSSGFKKYSICWVFQALSVSLSLSLSFSLSLSLYLCPLIIFE